jgi:hypothetical protein
VRRNDVEVLGPARTKVGDWLGTASADRGPPAPEHDEYSVTGLSRDRWLIVAIEAWRDNAIGQDGLTAYAVDKQRYAISSGRDAVALARVLSGRLPVVRFRVSDAFDAFVSRGLTQLSVRLDARAVIDDDISLEVTGDGAVPSPREGGGDEAAER